MSNAAKQMPLVIPQEVKDQLESERGKPEFEWARRVHTWDLAAPEFWDNATAWADHGGWDVEVVERNKQGQVTAVRGDIFRVMWQMDWLKRQSA